MMIIIILEKILNWYFEFPSDPIIFVTPTRVLVEARSNEIKSNEINEPTFKNNNILKISIFFFSIFILPKTYVS